MFRLLFSLLYLALVGFAIYDLIMSNKPNDKKFLWVIVIFLFPFLGAIIYLVAGRNSNR